MVSDIRQDIARAREWGLIKLLLADRTTGHNIIWATEGYAHLGEGYAPTSQMTEKSVCPESFGEKTCGKAPFLASWRAAGLALMYRVE